MKKEVNVVAALVKKGKQFLLCQRKEGDRYGLLWEFPGGTVEAGEGLSPAITREMKEELALEVKPEKMVGEFHDQDRSLKIKVFLFACSIKGGAPQAEDCRDFGFFTIERIAKLDLAPVDRKIFSYLKENNDYRP